MSPENGVANLTQSIQPLGVSLQRMLCLFSMSDVARINYDSCHGGLCKEVGATEFERVPRSVSVPDSRIRCFASRAAAGPTLATHRLIGTGLANEALEVVRCLRNGETESPLVPLDDSLALMRQMDTIRGQIGVRYAADA